MLIRCVNEFLFSFALIQVPLISIAGYPSLLMRVSVLFTFAPGLPRVSGSDLAVQAYFTVLGEVRSWFRDVAPLTPAFCVG